MAPSAEPQAGAPSVLSTLNDDGSRRWIRPKVSSGRFLTRRRIVAYVLILIFTAVPYLKIHGKPMMLLDLATRRFTFFGRTFLPTDTLLLALLLVGTFVTIFLITALFGRIWCGWACPQTVYMEFVFRPIERLFEGAPGRAKGPLAGKPFSKPAKYLVYLAVAMYLAHTFLAYFVGVENLRQWVTQSPVQHPGPFLVMLVVTGLMMFDFTFFREQTCILACPYGRFQSALLDRDSLIVSYDRSRGEPRGKGPPRGDLSLKVVGDGGSAARGDCVDCGLCVATCPTGIDIRNGLQMECIGCAQCIDACDAVMAKLKRPLGLIRYSSQAIMSGAKAHLIRPRVVIYPLILLAIATAFTIALRSKGPADVTVLRGVGRPFVELGGGVIGNPIKLKVVNRTDYPASYDVRVEGAPDASVEVESHLRLAPGEAKTVVGMLKAPQASFHDGALSVRVVVTGEGFEGGRAFRMVGPAGEHREEHHEGRGGEDHR